MAAATAPAPVPVAAGNTATIAAPTIVPQSKVQYIAADGEPVPDLRPKLFGRDHAGRLGYANYQIAVWNARRSELMEGDDPIKTKKREVNKLKALLQKYEQQLQELVTAPAAPATPAK